jgi:hypothetical protein
LDHHVLNTKIMHHCLTDASPGTDAITYAQGRKLLPVLVSAGACCAPLTAPATLVAALAACISLTAAALSAAS